MMKRYWQLVWLSLLVLLSANLAQAERRVALVIGNSNYTDATPLDNALNDANDIAAAFRRLKFDVVLGIDLDRNQTYEVLKKFNRKLVGADTAVLYYAGHALQVGGVNYIAPIDTLLEHEVDLELETISMNLILRQMERNAKTLLVFLDACRNNPLSRRFARKNRSASAGRGLAKPEISSEGTFIAFATQPGNVALDGKGRNSPFTTAMLKHIEKPGIDISSLMIDVRADVYKATSKAQLPWTNSGLLGRFYFNDSAPKKASITDNVDNKQKELLKKFTAENTAWQKVSNTGDKALLEGFLTEFPNGIYSSVAKFEIGQIENAIKQKALALNPDENTADNKELITALLTPTEDDISKQEDTPEAPVTRQLIRAVQKELSRIGCDAGVADGQWGKKGRSALKDYSNRKDIKLTSLDPSQELLDNLLQQNERVCPLICSSGFEKVGDGCVQKACATGQKRNRRGQCYKPKTKTKTVRRKSPRGKNCFKFNGKTICE